MARLVLDQIYFCDPVVLRVNLLSYERKTTDKREQYDWRAEKTLDGWGRRSDPKVLQKEIRGEVRKKQSVSKTKRKEKKRKKGENFSLNERRKLRGRFESNLKSKQIRDFTFWPSLNQFYESEKENRFFPSTPPVRLPARVVHSQHYVSTGEFDQKDKHTGLFLSL